MKGRDSYKPEDIYQTNSVTTMNVNKVEMIPYGYPKNFKLVDQAKPGDGIVFKGMDIHEIKAKCVVNVASPVAEAFAQLIYGVHMREVLRMFQEKYKRDIQNDNVLIVIYQ